MYYLGTRDTNRNHSHKTNEHSYKLTTFNRTFYFINPEGLLWHLQLSEIKSTNVWNWSLCLKPNHTSRQTHTHRAHTHSKRLCVTSLSLMDRITSYSHPHKDCSAGTELRESQLSEGHVAQHRIIYQYTDTQAHIWARAHKSHTRCITAQTCKPAPKTLPWSQRERASSHNIIKWVSSLQLKKAVYFH